MCVFQGGRTLWEVQGKDIPAGPFLTSFREFRSSLRVKVRTETAPPGGPEQVYILVAKEVRKYGID